MKHYFIYTTFGLLCFLQLSCANKSTVIKPTNDTVYLSDSMLTAVEFTKLPLNFTLTSDDMEKRDTVMQGYYISYLLINCGELQLIKYYDGVPVFRREREVFVNIDNHKVGMCINKKINRSYFIEYLPKENIDKYEMTSFRLLEINSLGVVLYVNFCVGDTCDCYSFELHFNNKGEMKIVPIDEGPMGED